MSDLLSRLAARAVGAVDAAATPAPIPRFADSAQFPDEARETAVDVDVEEAPASTLGPRAAANGPAPTASRPSPGNTIEVDLHAGGHDDQPNGVRDQAAPSTPSIAADDGASVQTQTPARHDRRSPHPVIDDVEVDAEHRTGATFAVPAALPADPTTMVFAPVAATAERRAAPVMARPVPVAPVSPALADLTAPEPPAVTVHIRRLDVRVAPPPTRPARSRSETPGPDTTLAEYLRGHRGER